MPEQETAIRDVGKGNAFGQVGALLLLVLCHRFAPWRVPTSLDTRHNGLFRHMVASDRASL